MTTRQNTDSPAPGVNPGRVAEIIVDHETAAARRGSGYRVTTLLVLTAAHVVEGSHHIIVRFNADRDNEWVSGGSLVWRAPAADIALIAIKRKEGEVEPADFGRIGDRDAVLTCSALGYPRFKLRIDQSIASGKNGLTQYRDCCHLVGTAPVLSNRRQASLEILTTTPPAADPDPNRSPWEGMSGAAVFVRNIIVAVINEHHHRDGLGRLTATRIDTALAGLNEEEVQQLNKLLASSRSVSALTDVVGVSESAAVEATYLAVVRSIAPDSLTGRELELKNLVAFCAGNEPYQWIQAPAWSGKTALTSWFTLHPPAGIQVVSFFITSRLAGQADADGLVHAIINQLMAFVGKVEDVNLGKGPLTGQLLYQLECATTLLRNRNERLLLVVDGLDEDQGSNPSIAALLPRRPPDEVRILVSSRPRPGLPDDVPGDHPLRSCQTLRLSPSPYARHQEIESIRELNERLFADTHQRDIIALITASGGGLSARDLGELTERPRFEVAHQLNSYFGRSLSFRASPFGEAIYLLAHETLQATAEKVLDADIAPYRERIHAWAERYKTDGWPTSTPGYLLERYGRLLSALHDRDRLIALACDSKRHEQMMRHTRSDFAAMTEITAAQQELKSSRRDLASLSLLAIERERVANRGAAIPASLADAWGRLGQTQHALELIATLPSAFSRAQAQASLADVLAHRDPETAVRLADQAERAADSVTDLEHRKRAVGQIAVAFARAGQTDRAQRVADGLSDPGDRASALAAAAGVLAGSDPSAATQFADQAERLVGVLISSSARMLATAEVAASLAYYQPDRASRLAEQAEQLAWTVTDSATRAAALAQIAIGYARAGEWDQAERAADSVTDLEHRKRAVGQIAVAFARAGQTDRAQRVADGLSDPGDRASALAAAAGVLAGSDPSTATQFADQAEQLARTVADYEARSRVLAQVIVARFRTNQQNYTAKIWPLAIGRLQPWEKADLAVLLANIDPDSAVSLADEAADLLGSVLDKAAVLTEIAVAIAKSGQTDRAERIARSLRSPRKRARIAAEVAAACARAGQWDRADRITRTIRDSEIQVQARIKIITVLADVGQWDRCEEIVQAMGSSPEREQALVIIAERMACVIPHLGDSQDRLAEKFRHILARVLVSEHWNLALPVFGQAAPEELAAVLEAVTRDDMPE